MDDESDFDGDDDLKEQGMDWDDMEREAAADDRRKKVDGDDTGDVRIKRKQATSGPPKRKQRRR